MTDFSQLLQLGQQMQGKITQMQTELTQRSVTGGLPLPFQLPL